MNNTRHAKLTIATGLGLIVLAILLILYWWMNQTPLIVQEFLSESQNLEIIIPQEEEKEWQLEIPKIEVNAPIILNINGADEDGYLTALENGVAHLSGSKIPGQSGNVFIFGHSSYYFYAPGEYKSIFRDLDQLELEDEIKIKSNLNTYNYRVINKKIVNPDEVDIIKSEDDKRTLTLMTCYPLYTSLKRLVITAEEVQ